MYFPDVWGINGSFPVQWKALDGLFRVSRIPGTWGGLLQGVRDSNSRNSMRMTSRQDYVQNHRKDRNDTTTEPGFDYEAWKKKHIAFANEHVPIWMDAVAKEFGSEDTKYAAVGYCFGAPYVMNALAGPLVSAGAFGHPAFFTRVTLRDLLVKPLFLSCAETDHTFPDAARHRAEEILKSRKQVYHFQLFSGVEHGFALRGNMDDPYERWVKEESAAAIIRWFKFFLK
ncbi:hypothetical protein VNI00_014642 [Paramarasmius palmivorus]|uniref:Dienelactone hydrolase domain-containing protein n=1 Tax=Paramarasmius palmivorus TaxID=297713 RepID=A0AAW0BSA0_9AGAR